MSDSQSDDELDELRERKLEELKRKASGEPVPTEDGGAAGGTGAPDEPIHVEGPEHYRELVQSHDVALVDFYADWCGPCKMIEPAVEQLAAETDAAVLKVDIDAHQGLARDMQVQGVPTLYVYSDGEVAERVVGVKEKHQLRSMIEAAS